MSLKLVNWNVEWATPASQRTPEILSRVRGHAPEIVCLTETHDGLLSQDGHTICSQPDYGYPIRKGRRKVLLWSKEPWKQVENVGIDSMPPGRFVSGVTQTSVGDVTVIGICIPWFGSRTEAKRKEPKKQWEDHEKYLNDLTKPESTDSYRWTASGQRKGVRELQARLSGLASGRREVAGRPAGALGGADGGLRWARGAR